AVAAEYSALLFLPSVALLAALAAWPRVGAKAMLRPVVLGAGTAALIAGTWYVAGAGFWHGTEPAFSHFTSPGTWHVAWRDLWSGITAAPPSGAGSPASAGSGLRDLAWWVGLPFALAVIGAVAYAIRPSTEGSTTEASRRATLVAAGGRSRRVWLGVVLTGSALLAGALQLELQVSASREPVAFGLLLSAPMAGVGLARIVGDHFRRTQIGIAVWAAALAIGMTQANDMFNTWPDSATYMADMTRYLRPGARYLVEGTEIPDYYLRNHADARPGQFTGIGHLTYPPSASKTSKKGKALTGDAAYTAAIRAGYFRVIAYHYGATRATDIAMARVLAADPHYRLAAVIPDDNDLGRQYIWVKTK
ncbi:MAG: hypothetical protein J2P25_25020, partial [Nocardiopsaceae bacterium]|nr:hypothetical protein [Nocardiopsaceae bacterium]